MIDPIAPRTARDERMCRWLATPQGLCAFIDASPSPFHVCATVADRLRAAGYTELAEGDPWPTRRQVLHRPGRLAGRVERRVDAGGRRSASSAATPTARTCGSSSIPTGSVAGWQVVALEPYGGAWLNSWLDRDLGHQRAVVAAGGKRHRGRAGPHRRPDPAGAAAGHPPLRGPQGRSSSIRSATSMRYGGRRRHPARSSASSPAAPASIPARCWPPT